MYTGIGNLLQTYGNELITARTLENYVGFYNITPEGIYSGLVREAMSEQLLKIGEINTMETTSYASDGIVSLNNLSPLKSIKIDSYYPKPTDEDYITGYFTRYFCKHKLHYPYSIFEISKDTYDEVRTSETLPYILYQVLELEWVISDLQGKVDIRQVNIETIQRHNIDFKGISKYFINLKEFSKI